MWASTARPLDSADDGWVYGDYGLTFTRDVSRQEWQTLGSDLKRRVDACPWWVGDWLAYGGARASTWGDTYRLAIEATGFSETFLSQCHQVARVFPPSQRYPLSWSHHRAVLAIHDHQARRAFLGKAADEHWSVAVMESYFPKDKRAPLPPAEPLTRRARGRFEVECPACHHVFAAAAHKLERKKLNHRGN